MKELMAYILQFGTLNRQQIDFVEKKATAIALRKDEYFSSPLVRVPRANNMHFFGNDPHRE
ncbi:MAG: hypothetical protein RIB86_04505 [Imperialibacter sp.]